jgi:hypothetical protein
MTKNPKQDTEETKQQAERDPNIMTVAEFANLTTEQQNEFRMKNGTLTES